MTIRLLPIIALCLTATACSHSRAEEAPRPVDAQVVQHLKDIRPPTPAASTVVLYRNTRFGGFFGPMSVSGSLFLDEQGVGDVADDTYSVMSLPPGRHSLRVLGTVAGNVLQATTVVTLAPGEVKWVELATVQEFSGVSVKLLNRPEPPLSEIARDCKEGFVVDVSDSPAAPKTANNAQM